MLSVIITVTRLYILDLGMFVCDIHYNCQWIRPNMEHHIASVFNIQPII